MVGGSAGRYSTCHEGVPWVRHRRKETGWDLSSRTERTSDMVDGARGLFVTLRTKGSARGVILHACRRMITTHARKICALPRSAPSFTENSRAHISLKSFFTTTRFQASPPKPCTPCTCTPQASPHSYLSYPFRAALTADAPFHSHPYPILF